MSFLKKVHCYSSIERNKYVQEIANESGFKLSVGDNFDYFENEDDCFREEGVLIDENFIKFLESQGVEFSDILREDFHSIQEGDSIEIYLKDESGLYRSYIFLEHLEIDGLQCLDMWLDFSNLIKELHKTEIPK